MGITRRHTLYGCEFDTDSMAGANVVLGGIKGQLIEAETEVRNDTSSGEIYPTHLSMPSQRIMATMRTTSIAAALNTIGTFAGLPIFATTQDGVNLFAYKHAEGGGRTSGGAHRKFNVKQGIAIPRRITCQHQGDAELEFVVLATWDGTNSPVVVTDAFTLPTNGTDAARFTIGKCTINSDLIDHITSWELDFGILSEMEGSDSDKWPTFVSVQEAKPIFRLRGVDIEWFKSTVLPLEGSVATHATTTIYLRKRSAATSSGFVADATQEHISFTAEGLAHLETLFDGTADGNPPAQVSLSMPCRYDGTNAPVVVDTTAAIA
jgi:hypothetical protein